MSELDERYPRTSRGRRRTVVVLVVVLALASLTWLGWVILDQSTPKVTSSLLAFTVDGDHGVAGVIEVARADTDTSATCFLRALAEDHATVGELALPVTNGAKRQKMPFTMRTERAATSVELLGCTAPGQNRRK
ncbi:MAG: DUF4307 domain-containing protein [Nocardioidaceae bacterium]